MNTDLVFCRQKMTLNTDIVSFVQPAITRLCGRWAGTRLGDTPWKDVEGALLAEVKSSAYGDLGRRPTRRLS